MAGMWNGIDTNHGKTVQVTNTVLGRAGQANRQGRANLRPPPGWTQGQSGVLFRWGRSHTFSQPPGSRHPSLRDAIHDKQVAAARRRNPFSHLVRQPGLTMATVCETVGLHNLHRAHTGHYLLVVIGLFGLKTVCLWKPCFSREVWYWTKKRLHDISSSKLTYCHPWKMR